jgi:ABC-2 type transport system ATP-binding protein
MHSSGIRYEEAVREFKKQYLREVLIAHRGNQCKAAEELGMHRNTLSRTIEELGLDPAQIVEMRDLIRSFGREHAVVFSSHILSEVRLLCDEVIIVRAGKVVTQGAPADLTAKLHGGIEHWLVRVKGPEASVAAALRGVRGVHAVSPFGETTPADAAEGVCGLRVEAAPGAGGGELSDRLFDALAAGGWRARELRRLETSLEEVFLELTATEQAAKRDARAAAPRARGGRER